MSEEKNLLIKKALVGLVFIGFLVSPILLKPGSSENLNTGSANLFGFELKDVANQSGIIFKHQQPILDDKIAHILPTIASVGAAVSVCDYNNDGWSDLYFTNSRIDTKNALFRNNTDGSFTFEFAKDIAEYFNAKYFRLDKLNEVTLGNVITMEKNLLVDALQGKPAL